MTMPHVPQKSRITKKKIAVLMLALTGAASALATPYTYRVPLFGVRAGVNIGNQGTIIDVPPPPPPATMSTVSFSTCGQTGRFGPTLAACQSAYASQPDIVASLAMTGYQGYQEWTVPTTGSYTLTAAAAGGGSAPPYNTGGRGAIIRAKFNLSAGTVLQVIVGQPGIDAQVIAAGVTDGGGGGGSFIFNKTGNAILLAAGGGGGANYFSQNGTTYYGNGGDGSTGSLPPAPPAGVTYGSVGNGEPGAGLNTDGALPGQWPTTFTIAHGFKTGAVGGVSTAATVNRFGGFGGGGGAHGYNCIGGGGGGGFSGGQGAAACGGGGGGGTNYNVAATNMATSDGKINGATQATAPLGWIASSTAGYVTITLN